MPFVFVIISHSIESAHKDGSRTKIIGRIDEFFEHAKKYADIKFLTLKEAYNLVK